MPTWRAWLFLSGLAFTATLVAAWKKVPGFQAATGVVWEDLKDRIAAG